jgi:hypothetical protein
MFKEIHGGYDPLPNQIVVQTKQEFHYPGLVVDKSKLILDFRLLKPKNVEKPLLISLIDNHITKSYDPFDYTIV